MSPVEEAIDARQQTRTFDVRGRVHRGSDAPLRSSRSQLIFRPFSTDTYARAENKPNAIYMFCLFQLCE